MQSGLRDGVEIVSDELLVVVELLVRLSDLCDCDRQLFVVVVRDLCRVRDVVVAVKMRVLDPVN